METSQNGDFTSLLEIFLLLYFLGQSQFNAELEIFPTFEQNSPSWTIYLIYQVTLKNVSHNQF